MDVISYEKDLTIAVKPAVCGSLSGRGTVEFDDPDDPVDCAVLGVALLSETSEVVLAEGEFAKSI